MKNSSNSNHSFDKQIVLVTGAAAGIGQATALEFAEKGAKVIVSDANLKKGLESAAFIQKRAEKKGAGEAIFLKCDISQENEVEKLMDEIIKKYGRLDIAFNNAGIEGPQAITHECSSEDWDKVINTNLRGTWLCMKYEIAQMLRQGSGSIVNCSSIAGLVGFQGSAAYVASKHGIVGLTQTAALEYAQKNIRINSVCPGVIHTSMIDRYTHGDKKLEADLCAREPMGRMGLPQEIASAVLWLSSSGASFVTGHSLTVDGGWVAR